MSERIKSFALFVAVVAPLGGEVRLGNVDDAVAIRTILFFILHLSFLWKRPGFSCHRQMMRVRPSMTDHHIFESISDLHYIPPAGEIRPEKGITYSSSYDPRHHEDDEGGGYYDYEYFVWVHFFFVYRVGNYLVISTHLFCESCTFVPFP